MKKPFIVLTTFVVLILSIVISVTQSSCSKQKDACSGVVCQHNGTCADGTCTCPAGFTGANCETAYSAQFTGTYIGTDAGSPPTVDTLVVTADTGAYNLFILCKSKDLTMRATVHGDTINIPSQSIPIHSFNETVSGGGSFSNGGVMSVTFSENLSPNIAVTQFTGIKR